MGAKPIVEELSGSASGRMISQFADYSSETILPAVLEEMQKRTPRKLAIYAASAGFELVDELSHLCARAIDPNVFFNPRFLAPAMPRLEDKEVRLAVIRDGDEYKNRLRLLVPFTIEKLPLFGTSVLRTWSSPFGPLGTPLVDHDDPESVIDDFFSMLARPHLNLPNIFVMPDVRLDGPFAALMSRFTESRGLPFEITNQLQRPHLQSDLLPEDYLDGTISRRHLQEYQRLKRRLGELGALDYQIARQPDEVRQAVEDFLALEASGWKGREGSAMAVDRYRAAFAREAAQRLAQNDQCRVHALKLNGKTIASLIVFVEAGIAYTWKTAYDENYARFSPGTLLMIEVTQTHLLDPNVAITDSCAVPDHPIVSRLWKERRPIGTLVVGLTADSDRAARRAATQLHREKQTRNMARIVRQRIRHALKRS